MKRPVFDVHSHWGTKRGYPLQSEAELARQRQVWNSDPTYHSEDEMADCFRRNGVQTILDFGFTKKLPIREVRPYHDYAIATQAQFKDAIFGLWLQINPESGAEGVAELRRCIDASTGFVSIMIAGAGMGYPAHHKVYDPFYDVCAEKRRPVLVAVGFNGAGAGLPGGAGMILDHCHPRHIDGLAARRPDLTIIAARPAWPWQDEMIAVLLHKPNVWYELHGWSPKYLTSSLKHEIPRRLKDRVMFGADYPLFTYERLFKDWRDLGFDEGVIEKVMWSNAARLFDLRSGKEG
jgi:uncharacterized protein